MMMDNLKHALFLLRQGDSLGLSVEANCILASQSIDLYGVNSRTCLVSFAISQAEHREKLAEKNNLQAFGMKELVKSLQSYKEDKEIFYYFIKTEKYSGEVYYTGDILIGFQFVKRGKSKSLRGLNPSI
ncbi:hypothetical protein [Halomonas binhaiensis]|uniref:Uncharacterized protein n=1 Tax=Halomonas binhaiensis TaxID=2562282 RepID=A0A5C1NHD8_9GAMM|nr:hypothetical protein [Halomonas binhaiensis]QEM82664.1 hypothetical protein E4T21_14745 [Halomonas binhaiensis]